MSWVLKHLWENKCIYNNNHNDNNNSNNNIKAAPAANI